MSTHAQLAYREAELLQAEGLKIVELLYEAAIDAIDAARQALAKGDIAARTQAINRAYDIVAELLFGLNQEAGGEIARRLAALYVYIQGLLLRAQAEQSESPLLEARSLLVTLLPAWRQANQPIVATPPQEDLPVNELIGARVDCVG